MKYIEYGQIRAAVFNSINPKIVTHGIFTRTGGVSPAPWDSLNVGGLVGDAQENAIGNRHRIFDALKLDRDSIFDVWQVHGSKVVCTNKPRPSDVDHQKADAILTNVPGVTLFMRFADCVPVMVFDPIKRVIGMIHAGWQGIVSDVIGNAIHEITTRYGSDPSTVIGCIGPSIGPDHYEVKKDVIERIQLMFKGDTQEILISINGNYHLDLWGACEILLARAGVKTIEQSKICTACYPADWFSHRGQKGRHGVFGALIALK